MGPARFSSLSRALVIGMLLLPALAVSADCPTQYSVLPRRKNITPFLAGSVGAHALAYTVIRPNPPAAPVLTTGTVTGAFSNTPSPPPAPAKPRETLKTEAELIAEAQATLRQWQAHGRWDDTLPDLGKFLVHSELRQFRPEGDLLTDLLGSYSDVRRQTLKLGKPPFYRQGGAEPEDFMEALAYLNRDAMSGYCESKALMTDFFTQACGNCEAHTKLMIAALAQGPLRLKPRYRLAMRSYADHVDPVIWDTEEKRVMPLDSGKWEKPLDAPLLDPAALLVAYLDSKKVKVDPSIRDRVVIERGPPASVTSASDISTNTPLDWDGLPRGKKKSAGFENPKFSVRDFGAGPGDSGESGRLSFKLQKKKHPPISCEGGKLKRNGEPMDVTLGGGLIYLGLKPQGDPGSVDRLYTTSPELIAAIKTCRDTPDLARIFVAHFRRVYAQVLSDPRLPQLESFLARPENLDRLNLDEVKSLEAYWREVVRLTETIGMINNVLTMLEVRDEFLPDTLRFRALRSRLIGAIDRYSALLGEQRLTIAHNLNRAPAVEREKFFRINRWEGYGMFSLSGRSEHFGGNPMPHPLAQLLDGIAREEIVAPQSARAQRMRLASAPLEVRILTVPGPAATDSVPQTPEVKTKTVARAPGPPVEAQAAVMASSPGVVVSPEVLIQFMLSTGSELLSRETRTGLYRYWWQYQLTSTLAQQGDRALRDQDFTSFLSLVAPTTDDQPFAKQPTYRVMTPAHPAPGAKERLPREIADYLLEVRRRTEPFVPWQVAPALPAPDPTPSSTPNVIRGAIS